MIFVGVTGPIATGKSSVCGFFSEMGAHLIDADRIGHEVLEDPSIKIKLSLFFGENIVDNDGNIDRKKIAEIVFSNKEALEYLEKLTHPLITNRIEQKIDELKKSGFPGVVVIDAAMLPKWPNIIESLDYIVMVQSPRWHRTNRLIQDRRLDKKEAERIIDAQEGIFDSIAPYLDYIIKNNGELSELRAKTVRVWLEIKEAAKKKDE